MTAEKIIMVFVVNNDDVVKSAPFYSCIGLSNRQWKTLYGSALFIFCDVNFVGDRWKTSTSGAC